MSELFVSGVDGEDIGYAHVRDGRSQTDREIKDALQQLWDKYEPYADSDFRERLARELDERFWEMYLACMLLDGGKHIRERKQLSKAERDTGPDICIEEDGRKVWIEAICPTRGDPDSLDRVPDIRENARPGEVVTGTVPQRQIHLRLTAALDAKRKKFQTYIGNGLVGRQDCLIVAVNGARFYGLANTDDFPALSKVVYPLGNQRWTFEKASGEVTKVDYEPSYEIEKSNGALIRRDGFNSKDFEILAGAIWSSRSIGNFTLRANHDLTFVHNVQALTSLPTGWFDWSEEVVASDDGQTVTLQRVRSEGSAN